MVSRTALLLVATSLLAATACSGSSDDDTAPSSDDPIASGEDDQPDTDDQPEGDDQPVASGDGDFSELEGVWDSSVLSDGPPASRLFIIEADGTLTDSSLSTRDNCYSRGISVTLVPLGGESYEADFLGTVTLAVQDDTLTYSYEEGDGRETFEFPRIAGLSPQDVQRCS